MLSANAILPPPPPPPPPCFSLFATALGVMLAVGLVWILFTILIQHRRAFIHVFYVSGCGKKVGRCPHCRIIFSVFQSPPFKLLHTVFLNSQMVQNHGYQTCQNPAYFIATKPRQKRDGRPL
jgi:hypothetical protein